MRIGGVLVGVGGNAMGWTVSWSEHGVSWSHMKWNEVYSCHIEGL